MELLQMATKASIPEGQEGSIFFPAIHKRIMDIVTICRGLVHGIEVELAFILTPEKELKVMADYSSTLEAIGDHSIRSRVRAMLGAISHHFPEYQSGTSEFMRIRYHFFNKLGLWGRTG